MPQTILITGGTGLVGAKLCEQLMADGNTVIVLTRKKEITTSTFNPQKINYAYWSVDENYIDENAFSQANAIVHLAGESVAAKRWTTKQKQIIVDSRVKTGELLIQYLATKKNKVKTIVAASAIGWYKPQINLALKYQEEDEPNNDFLGETCKQWEQIMHPAKNLGIRLVTVRIGIVLSSQGGALKEFLTPIKYGFATIMGNGKQLISWISILDLCRLINFSVTNEKIQGVYNAVAPNPISNKSFMLQLAVHQRGKWFIALHIPSFILKNLLGDMSIEILKSSNISCKKIVDAGFSFCHSSLKESFNYLLPKTTP
jgi:hypothetical protein